MLGRPRDDGVCSGAPQPGGLFTGRHRVDADSCIGVPMTHRADIDRIEGSTQVFGAARQAQGHGLSGVQATLVLSRMIADPAGR